MGSRGGGDYQSKKKDPALRIKGDDKIILTMLLYLTAHPYFCEYMEGRSEEEIIAEEAVPEEGMPVWLESCIADALPLFEGVHKRNELLYGLREVTGVNFDDVFDPFVAQIKDNVAARVQAGDARDKNRLH